MEIFIALDYSMSDIRLEKPVISIKETWLYEEINDS